MQTKILLPTHENLRQAAELIRRGEIVAFPTETIYGLGADGLNVAACRKIFAAKGRPSDKSPMIARRNLFANKNFTADA